jgi:hypothetical protein
MSLSPLEAIWQTLQEAGSSNIDGVENTPVTYYVDGDKGYNPFVDDGMSNSRHSIAAAQVGAPTFSYTNEQKWTVALLKIVDDMNQATNGRAFGKILLWAREASAAQYSFYPQGDGGMSRNKKVLLILWKTPNSHMLPSVYTVPIMEEANGPTV